MRVLILGSTNSRNAGGVFNSIYMLGRALYTNPDVDVHFLLHDDEYSSEDRSYYAPMPLHTYSIKGPSNLGYSTDLIDELTDIKPDVVHTQGIWMYFSYANRQYYRSTQTPYIIAPHGMLDTWQLKQSFFKNLKKRLVLFLYETTHLRQAACIQALCQSEYESIRAFGLKNPVAIIPNGTELPTVMHRTVDYPIVCRWNQASNRKTLLFLSRIHPKKGLDNLLKAWAMTQPDQHEWQLVIAGETKDTVYWEALHKQVLILGIKDTVQFIGGQFGECKAACFIDAEAFILPSFSEGLPMAVLEAMSYRVPVLITTFCNIPAAFTRKAAIAIAPSPESIAAGINELLGLSKEALLQLGQNGYKLVEEQFTWEKVAADAHNLYQWVLGKGLKPDFVKVD
jgi:glycosyltransferase involved in cell wall biosynthesis